MTNFRVQEDSMETFNKIFFLLSDYEYPVLVFVSSVHSTLGNRAASWNKRGKIADIML